MFRLRPIPLTAALLLVAAAACSTDDAPEMGGGSTSPTTFTTTAPSRPSSVPGTPPTTVGPEPVVADGSGCTSEEASLPDGRWFGLVTAAGPGRLDLDLACWFSGQAAVTAAAEDGAESPPPNDYHIRNRNPLVRSLPVHAEATVRWVRETGDPTTALDTAYDRWLAARADGMVFGVWVELRDGQVRHVTEQWVP